MLISFNDSRNRFEAESRFSERDRCKDAGLRWDPVAKCWWTGDWRIAESLAAHCCDSAHAQIECMRLIEERSSDASRATDAEVAVPAPEGLAYLPFQRAGIAYALRAFGDIDRAS